ncbi:HpcH/HpaI aldolase family protein [Candidatus Lucifugimonas marina]|uniref:HpcH/HpaI aldolase family protein n=1 Tax=Candidatus Lucifugimonas marina TaxID=3038979 RepID=UPI00319DD18E
MKLRTNRAKQKLENGEIVTIVSGITHPDDIDAVGPLGFDGIWFEGEHGATEAGDLGNLTRACDLWGMTSVARINLNEQGLIYRTLDRGAQSIVVPHVNNAAEAQNVVDGGKFTPIGKRGMFTSRQGYGVENYFDQANDQSLLVILLEDIIAWENLDEILAVEGIDVFFVAPSDFAASMGHMGDLTHPDVVEKINDSLKRIVAAGKHAGALATTENVAQYVEMGVRFFMTGAGPWIAKGYNEFVASANSGKK